MINAKSIKNGEEETIVITEKVVFIVCDEDKTKIYKDYVGDRFIEGGKEFVSYYTENQDPISGDSALYDYTFVKDNDGIFVFTSVERVK